MLTGAPLRSRCQNRPYVMYVEGHLRSFCTAAIIPTWWSKHACHWDIKRLSHIICIIWTVPATDMLLSLNMYIESDIYAAGTRSWCGHGLCVSPRLVCCYCHTSTDQRHSNQWDVAKVLAIPTSCSWECLWYFCATTVKRQHYNEMSAVEMLLADLAISCTLVVEFL